MRQRKDRHHRLPRSLGGTNDKPNISIVPRNKHASWHVLFANHTAEEIATIINRFWLDPAYYMVAVPRRKT